MRNLIEKERTKQAGTVLYRSSVLFFSVALTAFASCSSDNDNAASDSPAALQVTSGIENRAAGGTWTAGDAIGIYSLDGNTVEYANRQYTTEDGGATCKFKPSTSDQTVYFPIDGSMRNIIAYYPYSATVADGVYTVDVSSQSNQEAIDLMTSALVTDRHKDAPAVNLSFAHKLSKIVLSIQPGNGLTTADLAGMTVTLTNQIATGTINAITNGSSVTTAADATKQAIVLNTAANGQNAEAIVLPAASTAGMNLVFNLTGFQTPFTWNIANATKSQSFKEGMKYTYAITINRIGIDVTANITDWIAGNGSGGENGTAE